MNRFEEYLLGRGLARNTIKNYCYQLDRAQQYARAHGYDLLNLKPSQARAMVEAWPASNASRRQLRVTLSHYWRLNQVEGPEDSIRVPKAPIPRFRGLPDDQVRRLLEVARADWPRGGAVHIALYLGLRRETVARLKWSDFYDDFKWVRVYEAKYDRVRDLPVHERLREALLPHQWPGEYVFPHRHHLGHVSAATINNWVSTLCKEAGIGHVHPHQFRHTSGGRVYEETGDIYLAMEWLGHLHISSTQVYTRVGNRRLLEGMGALNWQESAA